MPLFAHGIAICSSDIKSETNREQNPHTGGRNQLLGFGEKFSEPYLANVKNFSGPEGNPLPASKRLNECHSCGGRNPGLDSRLHGNDKRIETNAEVAKLVDAQHLKCCAERHAGSTPALSTANEHSE